jgi:hypothetical protein
MAIETSAQWWREMEQNWGDLVTLLQGCELHDEVASLERLKARRDAAIARRLLAAQRHAPARRARERCRGWRTLADLCAEQWVLHQAVA